MPDSLQVIGEDAFFFYTVLASVTLPNRLTIIGGAFQFCTGLKSVIFPKHMKVFGQDTLSQCAGLGSVHLPDGLEAIEFCAFEGCSGLVSAVLPAGLKRIEDQAFRARKSMRRLFPRACVHWKQDLRGLHIPELREHAR